MPFESTKSFFELNMRAVAVIGDVGDDEGLRVLAFGGSTTGVLPRPYLLTKSRSRWSCAGQPKMAPVP